MRTYDKAIIHSMKNPTELVEFKEMHCSGAAYQIGFFLNGEREGVFEHYRYSKLAQRDTYNSKMSCAEHLHFKLDGSVSRHYFSKDDIIHGEYKWFNIKVNNSKTLHTEHLRFISNGTIQPHHFYNTSSYHGENMQFNEDGTVNDHCFYNAGDYVKELDELLDAERDEAFYNTVASHGIGKEYIF